MVLGGPGASFPGKKLEIRDLQTVGNALKLSILPSPCYFCIILNILRSHQSDLFGSWGGGGVRTPRTPLPTGLGKLQRPPIEQASLVMSFYFVVLASFIRTATRNSPGYPS